LCEKYIKYFIYNIIIKTVDILVNSKMSFSDFTKNENKSIIWGLLQEGGIFNDIPNTYFENIKKLFETSIVSMKPDFDVFFDKNDEGDDDDDFVQHMHVGPGRPKIAQDKNVQIDDELSPYVTVRLAVARARALARYRELHA